MPEHGTGVEPRRRLLQDLEEGAVSSPAQRDADQLGLHIVLYGLPDDFPRLDELLCIADTNRRADAAASAFAEVFGDPRFRPYFQRHEFEALLFADLDELRRILDDEKDREGLEALAKTVATLAPEDIDDGPITAPSKRLEGAIRSYDKVVHGSLAVQSMGLAKIRSRCPRFDAWVAGLESLSQP